MMNFDKIPELNWKKMLGASAGLIILLSICAGAAIKYIDSQQIVEEHRQENVSFTVVDPDRAENATGNETDGKTDIGIQTGSHLHFGTMPNGTNQRRFLEWNTSAITLATVSVEGNASEHIDYEKKVVFKENTEYEVEMVSERLGYYEGVLKVKFEAPKTRWALKWLKFKSQHLY